MDLQPRINSKYLSHFIGRHILLMAEINEEVMQRHQQQQQAVVIASDGGNVLIHLSPGDSFDSYVPLTAPFPPFSFLLTVSLEPLIGNMFKF